MEIITGAAQLRSRLTASGAGALVPTMGNLHDGHLQLMRLARQHGDLVVASIFVNRLQFGPNEDFERYPRTFESDCAALEREGVDVLFAPGEAEMYPVAQTYRVTPPPFADELEGKFRPGFFHGVCTVVLKLFNLVQPDVAIFGKKDRQQLQIICGMVRQFNLPIQILAAETVRASDGLALSSRNSFLSAAERAEAPRLFRTLSAVARESASGKSGDADLEKRGRAELEQNGWKVDYVAIRDDLEQPGQRSPRNRIVLGAATLGTTRLVDNVDTLSRRSEALPSSAGLIAPRR
jgi:pantoate--beta-alanine ligase